MKNNLYNLIDKLKSEIIKTTQELVQIKSVESKPQPDMPFGSGVNDALEYTLKKAKKLGLKTKNIDGYAGHVEIGEGEEILGILCHLDVVPEGQDWTYPPYSAEIHDDKIYGRGSIDDKGPAISILYALKAIKDLDLKLDKRVRLILGTDEESGWEGLNYYLEQEASPDLGFSPDASFPVIHAEKGILLFKLNYNFEDNQTETQNNSTVNLKSITGGNAPNMVPDYCEAVLETDDFANISDQLKSFTDETGYKIEIDTINNEIMLKSYGISAHGSLPEEGHNAISQLMIFLNQLDLINNNIKRFIEIYNNKIGMEYNGQSIGCGFKDKVSSKLIFNVGMIKLDTDNGELNVNIRYPVTSDKDEVLNGINDSLKETDFELELNEHIPPLHVPKDDPLVVKLMKVYQEITGDKSEPIAIGGGTYARSLERGVAFGPLFPGKPELAHQKDEYIEIDCLIQSTKIYARAILELAKD